MKLFSVTSASASNARGLAYATRTLSVLASHLAVLVPPYPRMKLFTDTRILYHKGGEKSRAFLKSGEGILKNIFSLSQISSNGTLSASFVFL